MKVKIGDIEVREDRQRKKFENIDGLAQSISLVGLINPIMVEKGTLRLVAGERRLRACQLLEWEEIEVTFKEDADEWTLQTIELEENLRRENLTYAEEVEAKLRLHELYQAKFGKTIEGSKGGHRLVDTAELLGEAEGLTKMDVALAKAIRNRPELALKDNKSAAYKAMKSSEDMDIRVKIAAILAEDVQDITAKIDIRLGDALSVLKECDDESFDFCITDPPYLVNIDSSHDLSKTWDVRVDDHASNYDKITEIFAEVYRVLRPGAHCYIFYATIRYVETMEMLKRVGLWHSPIPLIWVKTGVPPLDPYRMYNIMYEPIFYGTKGVPRPFCDRLLPENVLIVPTQKPKVHPTQKPLELIKKLVLNCSVENELGLDPFAGSGTFAEACQVLNRRALVIEKDPEYYTRIRERVG